MPRFKTTADLEAYFADIKLQHARAVFRDELGQRKWSKFWREDFKQYANEQRGKR